MKEKKEKEEKKENLTTPIADRLLAVIAERYGTDTAFERAAHLPAKTVSNWRHGRSESYMKQLPALAKLLEVEVSALVAAQQTDPQERMRYLRTLLRKTERLPVRARLALTESLIQQVSLYLYTWDGEAVPRQYDRKETESGS